MNATRAALALLFLVASTAASAAGTERLKSFVKSTRTATALFTQGVFDKQGRRLQEASGVMYLSRPGRFRWEYDRPSEQLILGDGERLWIYDKELNQVTVRKLDQALGSTPAALLAGSDAIERDFNLADIGSHDGLDWLEATPKTREGGFSAVRLGFGEKTLERMELTDNFGQTTVIRFASLQTNAQFSSELFRFTPPAGADVIRD